MNMKCFGDNDNFNYLMLIYLISKHDHCSQFCHKTNEDILSNENDRLAGLNGYIKLISK